MAGEGGKRGRTEAAPAAAAPRELAGDRAGSTMPTYEFPEVADKYDITEKLGQGTYAVVYKAVPKDPALGEEAIALKRFKVWHNKPSRILNEAEMLAQCGGENYVVELRDVLRVKCDTSFLLPYFKHDSFRDNLHRFDVEHTVAYMTCLFQALEHCHRRRVLHRDVKPSNALYSFAERRAMLVDFGLAERMSPPSAKPKPVHAAQPRRGSQLFKSATDGSRLQYVMPQAGGSRAHAQHAPVAPAASGPAGPSGGVAGRKAGRASAHAEALPSLPRARAGTRGFRAPECLLSCEERTGAIDVWAAGIILLSILARTYPFINSSEDAAQLWEICRFRGVRALAAAARELERGLEISVPAGWEPLPDEPVPLESLCHLSLGAIPPGRVREELLKLTDRCLDPNPRTRISAKEAWERMRALGAGVESGLPGEGNGAEHSAVVEPPRAQPPPASPRELPPAQPAAAAPAPQPSPPRKLVTRSGAKQGKQAAAATTLATL